MEQGVEGAAKSGGFGRRLVAFLIDGVLVFIINVLVMIVVLLFIRRSFQESGGFDGAALLVIITSYLCGILVAWLYFAIGDASARQGTFGKRIMGLRVTSLDGSKIGFGRSSLRYVGRLLGVLTMLVGFLIALVTPRRRALHDYLAGTVVVRA